MFKVAFMALFVTVAAHAAPQVSYYDQLAAKYDASQAYNVDVVEDKTALIGRCFMSDKKDTPIGSTTLIRNENTDVGPIDTTVQKQIGGAWCAYSKCAAGYYDKMTYAQILATITPAAFLDYSYDATTNSLAGVLSDKTTDLFRQDSQYVYEKLSNPSTKQSSYCYYFKVTH